MKVSKVKQMSVGLITKFTASKALAGVFSPVACLKRKEIFINTSLIKRSVLLIILFKSTGY